MTHRLGTWASPPGLPSGATVQPKSRPRRTPDSLPLQRSGNLPRAFSSPDAPRVPAGVADPVRPLTTLTCTGKPALSAS